MKKGSKILLLWCGLVSGLSFIVFSQKLQLVGNASFFVTALELLIALISVFLFLHEPNRKNKFLFLNFAFFFLLVIVYLIYDVLKPFFASIDTYLPYMVIQYIKGANYAALAFAIVYLVLDSLFRNLRVLQKYFAAVVIVGTFFISYFSYFLANPKYGYTTPDIQDFRSVDRVYSNLMNANGKEPTVEQIAVSLTLPAWQENRAVGKL